MKWPAGKTTRPRSSKERNLTVGEFRKILERFPDETCVYIGLGRSKNVDIEFFTADYSCYKYADGKEDTQELILSPGEFVSGTGCFDVVQLKWSRE